LGGVQWVGKKQECEHALGAYFATITFRYRAEDVTWEGHASGSIRVVAEVSDDQILDLPFDLDFIDHKIEITKLEALRNHVYINSSR